ARLAQAQAAFEIREWKAENARRLRASETISPDALRDSELAARVAKATLAATQAAFDLVAAGPRAERIAQAQARVDMQAAAVDSLEDDKERHTIRAPFDGYVLREHTEEGQWLDQGGAVAEIAALDQVDVVVPVLEDYIAGLRLGMKKTVTVDSLPGRSFDATLVAIVPRADPRARTFPVKLRVDNPRVDGQPTLRVGLFVRMELAVGKKERMLLVPKDALVLGGPQPMVFVVDVTTKMAEPVPVRLGLAVGDHIQVVSGVAAGSHVVVRGNERLRPQKQPIRVAGK
ncbi:MAG: efflux RND transporter periplasmic adaptor subunit, partial [Planctomycetota bacterium]|nr:efflux RND transporter periplasmic adaptor subunit [Planctomycetota bacterium]